jgi:thioredoxin-related protein
MTMRSLAAAMGILLSTSAVGWADDATDPAPLTSEVTWHRFDDAIVAAKASGKHIMVDVYTDWCGWCKKLDKETYTDAAVLKVLSESYVSAKIKGDDAHRRLKVRSQPTQDEGRTLLQILPTDSPQISEKDFTRNQLRVTGFPTILFFAADGRMITKLSGFQKADAFANILNFIKDDLYEVMTYQDYLKSLEGANATKEKS